MILRKIQQPITAFSRTKVNRIETLQNFPPHEISDLRSEMKNAHNDFHAGCNKRMELVKN